MRKVENVMPWDDETLFSPIVQAGWPYDERAYSEGAHLYKGGGQVGQYTPSEQLRHYIAVKEGDSMRNNLSFETIARDFNNIVPTDVRLALSPEQLDALYDYAYNVGVGNLKLRVLPTLRNYVNGNATAEDVAATMTASLDYNPKYRGLALRRADERDSFINKNPMWANTEERLRNTTGNIMSDVKNTLTDIYSLDLSKLPSEKDKEKEETIEPIQIDFSSIKPEKAQMPEMPQYDYDVNIPVSQNVMHDRYRLFNPYMTQETPASETSERQRYNVVNPLGNWKPISWINV